MTRSSRSPAARSREKAEDIILWVIGFLLLIISAIIAQFSPFTSLQSGIAFFIFSILILTAMLMQTLKNKDINHVISKKPINEKTLKNANKNIFIMKMAFVFAGYLYAVFQLVSRIVTL